MWNDALPRNGITNWKTYYAVQGTDTTTGWQTWMKPAGCAWIYILMLAAGGGGGRSNNGSLTVAAGGGGRAGHTRLLIPAFVVPDILYVRPGAGGAGAITAGSGATGVFSYVAMQPNTTVANALIAQAGGGAGSGAASNAGATASAVGITTPAIQCLGMFTTVGGSNGAPGAASANTLGTSVTASQDTSITSAGGGGGNGTGTGGNITNAVVYPQINGGAGSTGGAGNPGFQLGAMWTPGLKSFPMIWSGGSGGGGSSAVGGVAGAGGNAAYGGGGGGGGSCTDAGGTSGNGGNGGDGIIFIGAF